LKGIASYIIKNDCYTFFSPSLPFPSLLFVSLVLSLGKNIIVASGAGISTSAGEDFLPFVQKEEREKREERKERKRKKRGRRERGERKGD